MDIIRQSWSRCGPLFQLRLQGHSKRWLHLLITVVTEGDSLVFIRQLSLGRSLFILDNVLIVEVACAALGGLVDHCGTK